MLHYPSRPVVSWKVAEHFPDVTATRLLVLVPVLELMLYLFFAHQGTVTVSPSLEALPSNGTMKYSLVSSFFLESTIMRRKPGCWSSCDINLRSGRVV